MKTQAQMTATVYECLKVASGTLTAVHYGDTERNAIKWLEENGGGVYRNALHRFQFAVEGIKSLA